MLSTLFYGLFILSCIVLVVTILLQPGKSDAGALFSSSVSSTAFGPRGTASILAKITIGAAIAKRFAFSAAINAGKWARPNAVASAATFTRSDVGAGYGNHSEHE